MAVNVKHPKFYPVGSLDNKRNFKRIARVFPDGSVVERIYLAVPDMRRREYLICIHYLRHITRHFLQDYVGFEIVSRDDPWDFRIQLNNGSKFNIEITSIADNQQQFEKYKREDRLAQWSTEEQIPLHELAKLATFFPDNETTQLVNKHKKAGISADQLIPNPYFSPKARIFVSTLPDLGKELTRMLKDVITKKAAKTHSEKENTVLIVDNRTGAYDVPEYFAALGEIAPMLDQYSFAEIWFYTGYYSDDDGNNAEFSFAPIKVKPEQNEILDRMAQSVDDHGVYYW